MNSFKNLVMLGSFETRVVPNDVEFEKSFDYVRHDDEDCIDDVPRQIRTPTIVTTTQFDNDKVFLSVASAMLALYEYEKMNERDTIRATLTKAEDVRAFLEVLDRKYFESCSNDDLEGESSTLEIGEIVHQVRSIFLTTLRSMWRESQWRGYGASKALLMVPQDEHTLVEDCDDEYYRKPPRTPKNLRLSPVACAYRSENDTIMYESDSCLPTPSKRPRRRFFADSGIDRKGCQDGSSSTMDPFASGRKFPELRFEIGGARKITNIFAPSKKTGFSFGFGSAFSSTKPVQSLELDGFGPVDGGGTYLPPTSPIRTVSNDLNIHAKPPQTNQ